MKFFTFIDKDSIEISSNKKIIPASEFSKLASASEILEKAKEEGVNYRIKVEKECEQLKEEAKQNGFEEGLKQFNEKIKLLENEIEKVRKETENAIVPIATAAVKKIIGKELEVRPEAVSDIITTALKSVSQHRKIIIYVNPADLDIVERHRGQLKAVFDHLESLTISPRDDIKPGGCTIETEAGIINAQLENQLNALEAAFRSFFQNHQTGG